MSCSGAVVRTMLRERACVVRVITLANLECSVVPGQQLPDPARCVLPSLLVLCG